MKKHLSVFGLYARSSIFKIMGILLLMGGVQIALFAKNYFPSISASSSASDVNDMIWQGDTASIHFLQNYIEMSGISKICLVGFLLLTFVLCMTGTEYSSKTSYTLKRLSVSEKSTYFHQAVYNTFAYVLFGAVQLVIIFIIGTIFAETAPAESVHKQVLFLTFYQDYFLHALFPMEDGLLWFRNVCWLIALGAATADFPYVQRRGSKFNMSLVVILVMVIGFGGNHRAFSEGPIGSMGNCIFTSFVAVMVVVYILACTVFAKEGSYEE